MTPRISLVIVTHNSAADLERCLLALPDAAGDFSFEVIVVDTESTDHTVAIARASALPLTLVELDNRGFASAANRGAARATGELLFFLNPDTVLPPGSLPRLLSLCLQDRVAAVSGLLVNADGKPETVGEPFPSLGWYLRRRIRPSVCSPALSQRPQSVPFLSGAALLVRRERFRHAGGFRESYFLYYEDIDLCRRLRAHGGVLLVDPRVHILHAGGRSAPLKERLALSDRAEDVYFSLHRPRREGAMLRGLRRIFRLFSPLFHPLVVMLPLAAVFGVLLGQRGDFFPGILGGVIASALLVLSARVPDAGVVLLLGSLLPGQLLRIPLGAVADLTFTDALLPWVTGGWLLALWRMSLQRTPHGSSPVSQGLLGTSFSTGVVAVLVVLSVMLPGLLLAAERLPWADWMIALGYAGRLLTVLLLLPLAARVLRRKLLISTGVLLVGAVLAILGLLQLAVFSSLDSSAVVAATCERIPVPICPLTGWDPHPGRLFSTWLDPNLLGGFLVIALAVLVAMPPATRRTTRVFLLAAGALLVFAVVLTKSRASLFALTVVAGFSLFSLRSWRRWFPLATAAVAGLVLVPSFVTRIQNVSATDPTVSLRVQSWQQALEHFTHFPFFGVGYNAYGFEQLAAGNIASLTLHSRAGADNSVLTLLATTGTWGIALFFLPLNALVLVLVREIRGGRPGGLSPLALLALSGMLAHAQFVHSLVYIHLLVPLALLLGGALRPSGDRRRGS